MKGLSILTLIIFVAVFAVPCLLSAEEYRVRGGKSDDFTDSQGRVWYGAQKKRPVMGRMD